MRWMVDRRRRGLGVALGGYLGIWVGLSATGCSSGEITGALGGYDFGRLRSVGFEPFTEEGYSGVTVGAASAPYSCETLGDVLTNPGDPTTGEGGLTVGLMSLQLLGLGVEPTEGAVPVGDGLAGMEEGDVRAVVYFEVFGEDLSADTLATGGTVWLDHLSRGRLTAHLEVETPAGPFSGELSGDPCDFPSL